MSFTEVDLIERLNAVARGFEMPPSPPTDDVRRGRRRARRNRGLMGAAAAAALVTVLGASAALGWPPRHEPNGLVPAVPTVIDVGDSPVWYDAKGLHRGDVVVQTAVDILLPEPPPDRGVKEGALALVQTGALYLDPATDDVWFHPWGGEPRIVGRNAPAGPGGDPTGHTAAWFEGSELVVYDTAAGREISRQREAVTVPGGTGMRGEHYPSGNGFLQVSAERIAWVDEVSQVYSRDVRTGRTARTRSMHGRFLVDVHDDVELLGERGAVVVSVPGQGEKRFPDLGPHVRLSPSGGYVLAPEYTATRYGPAIISIQTGEVWRTPKNGYPWIAWSYGDVAMVDTENALLACDPARRGCETLPAERPFLLPTS